MSKDHTPLTFGKYKGKTPEEVAEICPSYVVWMYENVKPVPCSKALRDDCKQDTQEDEADLADDLLFGMDGY